MRRHSQTVLSKIFSESLLMDLRRSSRPYKAQASAPIVFHW